MQSRGKQTGATLAHYKRVVIPYTTQVARQQPDSCS